MLNGEINFGTWSGFECIHLFLHTSTHLLLKIVSMLVDNSK